MLSTKPTLLKLARKGIVLQQYNIIARIWKPTFYQAIPLYMQPQLRDPFDYPLRSKQEVLQQLKNVGDVDVQIKQIHFSGTEKFKSDYNKTVKLQIHMDELKLSSFQKDRLIQLIGNRYKGDDILKLVVNVYDNPKQNIEKGIEMLKELYVEALRAPL